MPVLHVITTNINQWGYVNVTTEAFSLSPPASAKNVKAALSLKDGSWRVIGSSVTHTFLSDSDKPNNKGDVWSTSHSTTLLRDLSLLSSWQSLNHAAPTLLWRGFVIQMEHYNGLYSDSIQMAACSQIGVLPINLKEKSLNNEMRTNLCQYFMVFGLQKTFPYI